MNEPHKVMGVSAPTPRLTLTAAVLLALLLSGPTVILLCLIDWLCL